MSKLFTLCALLSSVIATTASAQQAAPPSARDEAFLQSHWVEININSFTAEAEVAAEAHCNDKMLIGDQLSPTNDLTKFDFHKRLKGDLHLVEDGRDIYKFEKSGADVKVEAVRWHRAQTVQKKLYVAYLPASMYMGAMTGTWLQNMFGGPETLQGMMIQTATMHSGERNVILYHPVSLQTGQPDGNTRTYLRCGDFAKAMNTK